MNLMNEVMYLYVVKKFKQEKLLDTMYVFFVYSSIVITWRFLGRSGRSEEIAYWAIVPSNESDARIAIIERSSS